MHFQCQLLVDPVIAADGFTYEREAIELWLQGHDTSPRTNQPLEHKILIFLWRASPRVSTVLKWFLYLMPLVPTKSFERSYRSKFNLNSNGRGLPPPIPFHGGFLD